MTDKQRTYINILLDRMDMKNPEQRKRFMLDKARKHGFTDINKIPDWTTGFIIESLEYVVNGETK